MSSDKLSTVIFIDTHHFPPKNRNWSQQRQADFQINVLTRSPEPPNQLYRDHFGHHYDYDTT